jgi:hypothetical protein
MNLIAFHILTVLASAGGAAAPENELQTELITKGVTMPDGRPVNLLAPLMPDGMTPAQQAEVLKQEAPLHDVPAFTSTRSNAPVSIKLGRRASGAGNDLIRTINVSFIVYGDWDVLTGKSFSESILKEDKAKNNQQQGGTAVLKAGYLKAPEMAVRGISARSTANLKEYYLYTTIKLFDEVEVSVTRFGAATKTPTGVVVAAKVDTRFANDKQFPNEWRPITRNAAGNPVIGAPQPYPLAGAKDCSGAGFYAKVTRLAKPDNAIFIEFHSTLYEPEGWFGSGNAGRLPTQLKTVIPFEVEQFRKRLRKATDDAAAEKKGEKPAEK